MPTPCDSENLIYCSGTVPVSPEGDIPRGKVGQDVTTEAAAEHARWTALHLLAVGADRFLTQATGIH